MPTIKNINLNITPSNQGILNNTFELNVNLNVDEQFSSHASGEILDNMDLNCLLQVKNQMF